MKHKCKYCKQLTSNDDTCIACNTMVQAFMALLMVNRGHNLKSRTYWLDKINKIFNGEET